MRSIIVGRTFRRRTVTIGKRLEISPGLSLPWSELRYVATRASGPGGQHTNATATRVELWWDLADSRSVTDAQRTQLRRRLATRLDRLGRLRLVAAASRSQYQNRQTVTERFRKLLVQALQVRRVRKPTAPTPASRERRLAVKKRRAERKRTRRRPRLDE